MIEDLEAALSRSPLHRWLGLRIVAADRDDDTIVVELPARDELKRGDDGDALHGGVIAMLADVAAHAVLHLRTGRAMPTIDLRVDYLRPAVAPLRAHGRVRRAGRTVGNADVDIFDGDGRLVATGRAVFLTGGTGS